MASESSGRSATPRDASGNEAAAGKSGGMAAALAQTLKDKLAISRAVLPYVAAAMFAALAMGWYFFLFVPQKLEYFVGQRFRTLAVASGQIKSKAESLGRSLSSAPAPSEIGPTPLTPEERWGKTEQYLRLIVPDIQLDALTGAVAQPSGLRLRVKPEAPVEPFSATVAWERVAAQGAAAASAPEFDDLVVAGADGIVVWQRENTTPRLGKLQELLYADDDKGTLLSPSWAIRSLPLAVDSTKMLPKTTALKAVRIGARSTLMLVQAVQLESPYLTELNQKTLYVAGFVSHQRLQQQAMRIPLAWLVIVWLPVAVVFLALPFIKLATMNAKERFSFFNLMLLAVSTVAAAGLAAVIPIGPRAVSETGDRVLQRIATALDEHLAIETRAVLDLAHDVVKHKTDSSLKKCAVPVDPWGADLSCNLWAPLSKHLAPDQPRAPELDIAVWLDARGDQVAKRSTKMQLTGRTPHRGFEHFESLASGKLWFVSDRDERFTIEPLRAPTTAELGVVFAMLLPAEPPSADAGSDTKAPVWPDFREAKYLAFNVRPASVVDAVLPPGYGFAIIAPDGRVLFHSSQGLSLEENFFEEVSNAQGVRERMQAEHAMTWSADYHGTPHRIYMQRVTKLDGCPWRIVTFQDLNAGLAAIVEHQSGTFRLAALNLLLLVAVALVGWGYTAFRGRDIRDVMTAALPLYPLRLLGLIVLMIAAAAALALALLLPHQWDNLLYFFFVGLPFMAIGVAVFSRCSGQRAARISDWIRQRTAWLPEWMGLQTNTLERWEVAMLVVLVGAVPAAGFAIIVQRVQVTRATEQWLDMAHQRFVTHADLARSRASNPAYDATTRELLLRLTSEHEKANLKKPELHDYMSESVLQRSGLPAECSELPSYGQGFVRAIVDWTIFSSERRESTHVKACTGTNWLRVRERDGSLSLGAPVSLNGPDTLPIKATSTPATGTEPDSLARSAGGDDLNWERWFLAALILSGTIIAVYWARRRLMTAAALGTSTFETVLNATGSDGSEGIMLVGVPRMRKDKIVKDAVLAYSGLTKHPDGADPIYRIRLLDKTIDRAFVKAALSEIAARVKKPSVVDSQNRLWIHISNLEAQLIAATRRAAVLDLLAKLLERPDGEPARIIVVTTSIDPIANFHEIFTKEREGIYDDNIPEVELSRSSLILSRFRRCYVPIPRGDDARGRARRPPRRRRRDPWWTYIPAHWKRTLRWEAAGYPALEEVRRALEKDLSADATARDGVGRADLTRAFRSRAMATYDLLWESCTRCEKIVLIQLAQEGFATTNNREVLWGLIRKGLIVERPRPTIFNNSFRQFLRRIENDRVVEQWEQEDGNGLWLVAGRLIGTSLIAGGLFYLTTQDFSVDSLVPVISGTGMFSAPALRALLARVTTRASPVSMG